jgi:hypothetical protein
MGSGATAHPHRQFGSEVVTGWTPVAYSIRGQIRLIAPDGTGDRMIVDGQPSNLELVYPIWSSDSRTIYYRALDLEHQSSIWSVS